jgi:hypothetical protein
MQVIGSIFNGEDMASSSRSTVLWRSGLQRHDEKECLDLALITISDFSISYIDGPHMISNPPDHSTFNGGGGGS